jgi:linoleate 10R-lipoxygenase
VRLDRPDDSYLNYGIGSRIGLGKEATLAAVIAMVRAVARLDNLRPAPGPQGVLKKVVRPGGYTTYLREDHGAFSPFPTSKYLIVVQRVLLTYSAFRVHYDGEAPKPKKRIASS